MNECKPHAEVMKLTSTKRELRIAGAQGRYIYIGETQQVEQNRTRPSNGFTLVSLVQFSAL